MRASTIPLEKKNVHRKLPTFTYIHIPAESSYHAVFCGTARFWHQAGIPNIRKCIQSFRALKYLELF